MTKEEIQKLAMQAIIPFDRAGCSMSMGSGKTLLGLRHADLHYSDTIKILVAGPKISTFDAWKDDAEKFGLSHLLPHITFTTYLSLEQQSLDFDIVYLDEVHNLIPESHEGWLSQYKGSIIGLTGTPPKHENSPRAMLIDKYCPIKYEYVTDEAVEDGVLNDYRIIVHSLNLNTAKTLQKKTKQGKIWYTSELDEYEYWCKRLNESTSMKTTQIMRVMRMKALMGFSSKEQLVKKLLGEIKGKTIIFANTQDQADRLCTWSYHSKNTKSDQNLQDFKDGKIQRLSCVLQLNEGVNIPDLRFGIIMHSYSNNRKLAQRLGRLLRLDPGEIAYIHVLCYNDTIDKTWVKESLSDFDQTKITWI